jgi:hypothetical protein
MPSLATRMSNRPQGVGMPLKVTFSCQNCAALYQLVRVEAGPESCDR